MIRRPPRSTLDRSSAASDVYKRQVFQAFNLIPTLDALENITLPADLAGRKVGGEWLHLSLIHISEPTRPY